MRTYLCWVEAIHSYAEKLYGATDWPDGHSGFVWIAGALELHCRGHDLRPEGVFRQDQHPSRQLDRSSLHCTSNGSLALYSRAGIAALCNCLGLFLFLFLFSCLRLLTLASLLQSRSGLIMPHRCSRAWHQKQHHWNIPEVLKPCIQIIQSSICQGLAEQEEQAANGQPLASMDRLPAAALEGRVGASLSNMWHLDSGQEIMWHLDTSGTVQSVQH